MQKDSAQAKISLKVVGGATFFTHPVHAARLDSYELLFLVSSGSSCKLRLTNNWL